MTDHEHKAAFKKVYFALYKTLYVHAFFILKDRDASEDIVQEVFTKVWLSPTFFELVDQPDAYLYRSVRNACYDHLKYLKRRTSMLETDGLEKQTDEPTALEQMMTKESIEKLSHAMEELPAQSKRVLELVFLEEKKYQEAADELQVSINTIKTQLRRGIIKLRATMKHFE